MTASIPITTVSIDENRQLTYTEYGDAGGTPVLFLHGAPGSRRLGTLFDTAAREHGIRLLAPDRPGYGQSPPWPDRSISDAGTFLTAVLDDAGVERAGLVAFSGGSAHALAATATHPDRINRVDVVAGATPPSVSAATPTPQRVLSGLAKRAPRGLGALLRGQAFLADRLDPSFVVAQYTDDPDSVPEAVQSVVKADFIEAFAESRAGAVAEFRNTANEWDIAFEAIDAEVCLWHGERDTNVPIAGARELKAQIPGAELRVFDDADHLQTLRRATPDALAAQGRRTTD